MTKLLTASTKQELRYGDYHVSPGYYSTSSKTASYSDPDLLIRDYFQKSDKQRAESRKQTAKFINNLVDINLILVYGINAKNGFDGAVNLLAEVSNFNLFNEFCKFVVQNKPLFSETLVEILIKAIACAYNLTIAQRFQILDNDVFFKANRMIKASIIDAMLIISDQANETMLKSITLKVESFLASSDDYIAKYAKDALSELN